MGLIILPPGVAGGEPEPEPEPDAVAIAPEELEVWVREAHARSLTMRRDSLAQEAVDRAIGAALDEGEIELAAAVQLVSGARAAGYLHQALELLLQLAVSLREAGQLDRRCRICGCTDSHACPGGCQWVEMDLCSACDAKLRAATRQAAYGGPVL